MKAWERILAVAVFLWGASCSSFGAMLCQIDAPRDDPKLRGGICDRDHQGICNLPELNPLQSEYSDLIQTRLWPLKLSEVSKAFGPRLDTMTNWWGDAGTAGSGTQLGKHPADLVLPIFAPRMLMLSGLHTGDPARDKSHTDLYAIGDIGYVEFYSQLDGEKVQAAIIYFRADRNFVPLATTNDFSRRSKWDEARFSALKKWFDANLPNSTDLGEVELSTSGPTRVTLGGSAACILTTSALTRPGATNLWYEVVVSKDVENQKERESTLQYKSIHRLGEPIGFTIDGKFYRLTPKLVEHSRQPDK